MVSFGEKAKIKKAGNLNEGRSYVITTVLSVNFYYVNKYVGTTIISFLLLDMVKTNSRNGYWINYNRFYDPMNFFIYTKQHKIDMQELQKIL